MRIPTVEELLRAWRLYNFPLYDGVDYDLNLFGIRSANREAGAFDDLIGALYRRDGEMVVEAWPATTDPGAYWLRNPGHDDGCAVMVAGHHRQIWTPDLHNGRYEALCSRQDRGCRPTRYVRDNDRDVVVETAGKPMREGYIGLNLHRASAWATVNKVGKYSAGCQVVQRNSDFLRLMQLAHLQIEQLQADRFSYTLFDEAVVFPESQPFRVRLNLPDMTVAGSAP